MVKLKAIVTIVVKDMRKGMPKKLGTDQFGRLSTDVDSVHKSFLFEGENVQEVTDKALAMGENIRISRVEVIE